MIDINKFNTAISAYKQQFNDERWVNEEFKWIAVDKFQKEWNIDADNFGAMFTRATEKTDKFLGATNFFPRRMIKNFAQADNEATRALFINLYDESIDLTVRIENFKNGAEELRIKYGKDSWGNHFQNSNAITTYLWLRYPEKYYIYKFSLFRKNSLYFNADYHPKKGYDTENIVYGFKFYDELNALIKKDEELINLSKKYLEGCDYKDTQLKTLTIDFGFYVANYLYDDNAVTTDDLNDEENGTKEVQNCELKDDEQVLTAYTKQDFLRDVYLKEDKYNSLVGILNHKKNIVLQGAPGVGKTYVAKRLAYSLIGYADDRYVQTVQFHQSYSYEDFIMGYRPKEDGFILQEGVFYTFCKKAEADISHKYYFIIDEINRGNLSKIFGELFMLIESDKRGERIRLLYKNELFSIPENVYLIGTMNTADRSLAMIDYALRRRFAFFNLSPAFEYDGFKKYQLELNNDTFDKLISCVCGLNKAICDDTSLGKGFEIGHSYFCNLKNADKQILSGIVEYEIIPLIQEYWFDNQSKVDEWSKKLEDIVK
jgi:hypothetical protein